MRSRRVGMGAAGAVVAVMAMASCAAGSTTPTAPVATDGSGGAISGPSAEGQQGGGQFITYADYVTGAESTRSPSDRVVLFFNATWCPTCHEAEQNLKAAQIPPDLTVVSVDFDSSQDLKEEYGVTTQHTFVQVDEAGEPLAKFTGSTTVDEIEQNLAD